MFNLQQLETLVLCVECGSFSAAAKKLGKAQSAVSTTIANLEIDSGIDIFDRSTRKPTLTPHGERLYTQALSLISQANSVRSMLHAFNAGIEDSISIAISGLLITPSFYDVIAEFYQCFPHTELCIEVVQNQDVIDLVSTGKSSMGFILGANTYPKNVELGIVGHLPVSIAVPTSHPLRKYSSATFHDLSNFRQVVLTDVGIAWNAAFSPTITKTNQLESMLSLLSIDGAWGFLPEHLLLKNKQLSKLEMASEEKNWLINVDRVVAKDNRFDQATSWLYKNSTRMFEI